MKKLAAVLIILVAAVAIAVYSYKQYKHYYPTPAEIAPPMEEMTQPGQQSPADPGR